MKKNYDSLRLMLAFVGILMAFFGALINSAAWAIFGVGGLLYSILWRIDDRLREWFK